MCAIVEADSDDDVTYRIELLVGEVKQLCDVMSTPSTECVDRDGEWKIGIQPSRAVRVCQNQARRIRWWCGYLPTSTLHGMVNTEVSRRRPSRQRGQHFNGVVIGFHIRVDRR